MLFYHGREFAPNYRLCVYANIEAQGYWAEWKWACPTKFAFELKTPYKIELGALLVY